MALALLLAPLGSQAQDTPPIVPEGPVEASPDTTFWVDVTVGSDSAEVDSLFGASFTLSYDESRVSVTGDEAGAFLGSDVVYQSSVDSAAGEVGIGVSRKSGTGGVSGSGVVARVQVTVSDTTSEGTELLFGLGEVTANDPDGTSISLNPESLTVEVRPALGETPQIRPEGPAETSPDSTFWVDVRVGSDSTEVSDLFGASFTLGYDESRVSVVEDEVGAFLGADVVYQSNVDSTAGEVGIGVSRKSGAGGVSGTGVAARVRVAVDSSVADSAQLAFDLGEVSANRPDGSAIALDPGSLTVELQTAPEETPKIRPRGPSEAAPDSTFWVDVQVGSDSMEVSDLFGASFTLSYDESRVSVTSDEAGAFLGSDVVYQSSVDSAAGEVGIGVSRKSGTGGVSGSGIVARVQVTVSDTTSEGTELPFELSELTANDPDGTSISLDPESLTVEVQRASGETPPIRPEGPAETSPDSTFWVDVQVGSDSVEVSDLFGTSFTLACDENRVSVTGDEAGSFFGSDVVYQSSVDSTAGEVGIGVSRKSGAGGVSGSGVVARVQVTVSDTTSEGTELPFELSEVTANDPDGNAIALAPHPLSVRVESPSDLPEVALADGREGIEYASPSPEPGTDFNPVGRLMVAAEQSGATLSSLTLENNGSSLSGVTSVELWRSADASFEAGNDERIASDTTATPAAFENVGFAVPTDSTYLFLVVDLEEEAGGDYAPVIRSEEALSITGGELATVNGTPDSTFADAFLSTSATALPVDLASFDARFSDETAILKWTTASETNNAGFAVQHRADTTGQWEKLSFVESKAEGGTTTEAQEYRFRTDKLKIGTHQFRLRQVDTDGTEHFSDPVRTDVRMTEAYRLTSYPNPARRQATVQVAVKEKQDVRLTLYDVLGRKVATLHDGELPAQETETLTINARRQGLSSGTYFLRLVGEEGTRTSRLTIVR